MDNAFLLGLGVIAVLGVGLLGGWWMGRRRQQQLQRELERLRLALQHSHTEGQQREDALQRSQQELQRSREELSRLREELQRSQQDFLRSQEESRQYRTQITQHFTQTAELLQTLTLNYRAVYEHLATGAAALCDGQVTTLTPETLRERLLAPPSEATAAEEVVAPQSLVPTPDAEQPPALSSQDPPQGPNRASLSPGLQESPEIT
jgi:uncharacterized membrane-anchored protein YhcB (DUF1043 family)